MSATKTNVRIGVDLGGTTTRIVAVALSGERVASTAIPTTSLGKIPHEAVAGLLDLVEEISAPFSVSALGIGASGPIDSDGVVRNIDTLPNLSGVSIPVAVETRFGVPTSISNDAATFALGERRFGAGRGEASVLGLTLGTGIGAAYVDDHGLFRGADGEHPEAGHIQVAYSAGRCYCGLDSCWEQAASRTALERLIASSERYPDTKAAAVAARSGQADAAELFVQYGRAVGAGVTTLCSLFRPHCVVLGGGSAAYADLFVPAATGVMSRPAPFGVAVELRVSQLGVFAGAVGASCLDVKPLKPTQLA